MSTVLVTKQNEDGTFDEVGMNNRRAMQLRTERGVINRLRKSKMASRFERSLFRLEWFHHLNDTKPFSTTFVTLEPEVRDCIPLSGTNRWGVRNILGAFHCSHSVLEAARRARPKGGLRSVPRELRRGWALCVIETHKANQAMFTEVMSCRKAHKTNIWGK